MALEVFSSFCLNYMLDRICQVALYGGIMRLKLKDIPAFRDKLAQEQGWKCWICSIDLSSVTACLDHDHSAESGRCRSVLCANCNGLEGRIFNLARRGKRKGTETSFVKSILDYWEYHAKNPRQEIHPSHRTQDEKRIARNKKARERRKKID
jgi:hypothetical protein